jgi:hypothetical protein
MPLLVPNPDLALLTNIIKVQAAFGLQDVVNTAHNGLIVIRPYENCFVKCFRV